MYPKAFCFRGMEQYVPKRLRKLDRDAIRGITKPDIRRLARRGGVKRIQLGIYNEARKALKDRLSMIIGQIVAVLESAPGDRKTITTRDVIYVLNRIRNPVYGFDHI